MLNHYYKKAGLIACFFLSITITPYAYGQEWTFSNNLAKAYTSALMLQPTEVAKAIPEPRSPQELYIYSLVETLELLITEDTEKFLHYEDLYESRLEKKTTGTEADNLFLQAELHLQWAFVYLKFGHELDAALNLRQAYQLAEVCKQKYPQYLAIKKTSGLLQVIIGSVPEKYNWVLSLLGIQGSVQTGMEELETLRKSGSDLALEADLLYALIQGFILQQPEPAVQQLKKLLTKHPNNRIALFLCATLHLKNNQSEDALVLLNTLTATDLGLPVHYANYLKGEIYLHKADYPTAISSYQSFITHYAGQNYIKDAYYKIGLCHWLNGNALDATRLFSEAKSHGREESEADKYAARSLTETELPHVKLSKVRYYTDGGYYAEAARQLNGITPADLHTKRDQVEFYYRQARLAHKTNQLQQARMFYQKVILFNADENWYFAPNACLQLGYLAQAEKDCTTAQKYFEKALTYKKHEYKNSIESKAKSALAQCTRK